MKLDVGFEFLSSFRKFWYITLYILDHFGISAPWGGGIWHKTPKVQNQITKYLQFQDGILIYIIFRNFYDLYFLRFRFKPELLAFL